jgi:AcrR family transcriptional regulator
MPRTSSAAARSRIAQGDRSRRNILKVAVDLASQEGLEGLTIGRLAAATGMSKSGLFAHFGSKEELQLATLEAARAIFIDNVIRPAQEAAEGLCRLQKLCEVWLEYASRQVFRGGCFFSAASAEFDGRPGAVHDRVAEIMKEWLFTLQEAVTAAVRAGQLDSTIDPAQVAFEINALEMGANWAFQLYHDAKVFALAHDGIFERLRRLATAPGLSLLPRAKYVARGKAPAP